MVNNSRYFDHENPDNCAQNSYYVLFAQTLRQWEVSRTIRSILPKDKGIVFYPCAELWMRSLDRKVIEPMFPGYIFVRSGLPRDEIHEYVRKSRREVLSFISELGKSFDESDELRWEGMTDLTEEESELMDFLLGFHYDRADDRRKKPLKLPDAGVITESLGYKNADGKYTIVEGPLTGYEDRIFDVDPKERRAYLKLKIGERRARVGLELRSKRDWFPKDKEAPVILSDGFEINTKEIVEAMFRPKK